MKLNWDILRNQFSKNAITRFAPSPTGYLHLGHVLSMAFVFGVGHIVGAKTLLRIEDHDRQRCRPEYEKAILDDMAWLGFIPDNWEEFTQRKVTPYRQSDRLERYKQALDQLQKHLYCCSCSRKEITASGIALVTAARELYYPGTCRDKILSKGGIRLRTESRLYQWNDLIVGLRQQNPAEQCGDILLQDQLGNYTYNFAVVVDDIDHGINLIVRGDDLLHCTARQMMLAEMLGSIHKPIIAHHGLLIDSSGKKLSKRFLSEGVIQRRLQGDLAPNVLGDALYMAGLIPKTRPVSASEVPDLLMNVHFC